MGNTFPSSRPLPGPVTASGAHIPTRSSPIAVQNLTPAGTTLNSPSISKEERFEKAWKYEGYKECAKWMASENDFFLFRRFESLNAGTIMYLQYRISELEKRLEDIHKRNEEDEKRKNSSYKWDESKQPDRLQIMNELSCLLLHYNQYIDAFSKIRARPRAERRQIRNMENWLKRGAITEKERDFINHKSDLISINHRSRPPLGRWLEAFQRLHVLRIFKAKPIEGLHVESDATSYSNDQMFERFTTLGIIATGLIMLLAPMWWLECVSDSKARLKIITGFVCVFIVAMTTATINKPFEVVAATAAYAAVLMVFMQIEGKGS